jgi:NAD(P)-dependent dehydrogenase (short-subunit alcohol dehydrogenase family)
LIAQTRLHHSQELYFRERVPWRIGLVRLDAGPSVVVHVHNDVAAPSARVRVTSQLDRANQAALIALPEHATPHMADDPELREMTCDPKFRKVLVTDGKTAVGQAICLALVAAGADIVWAGLAEPWKKLPGSDALANVPQITQVPLDVTNERSVQELAGEIGGKVDIIINNAEYHRTASISARPGTDAARAEMDVNYFGLLRLAQTFGPALRARAADGQSSAVAWVNVLSIYALSNFPAHGTFSASKAAAFSLAQCLRAEMLKSAIRVINVFPGPIDDEWNQLIMPPKLAPTALAKSIIDALRSAVEDVYAGDVAQEWFTRWRENPKALERELAL